MEKAKTSRKALKELVNNSMREAIGKLELPKASKRVRKLLDKSAKKIAGEFSYLLKKEKKRKKKIQDSLTYVKDVLTSKKKGGKKSKTVKMENQGQPEPAHA
jgi:hypothetical protein